MFSLKMGSMFFHLILESTGFVDSKKFLSGPLIFCLTKRSFPKDLIGMSDWKGMDYLQSYDLGMRGLDPSILRESGGVWILRDS